MLAIAQALVRRDGRAAADCERGRATGRASARATFKRATRRRRLRRSTAARRHALAARVGPAAARRTSRATSCACASSSACRPTCRCWCMTRAAAWSRSRSEAFEQYDAEHADADRHHDAGRDALAGDVPEDLARRARRSCAALRRRVEPARTRAGAGSRARSATRLERAAATWLAAEPPFVLMTLRGRALPAPAAARPPTRPTSPRWSRCSRPRPTQARRVGRDARRRSRPAGTDVERLGAAVAARSQPRG